LKGWEPLSQRYRVTFRNTFNPWLIQNSNTYFISNLSIYLSGLVTAVAVYRNPNTIPFCLTTDLLLNVLFSWLLVHFPSTIFFLDIICFFFISNQVDNLIRGITKICVCISCFHLQLKKIKALKKIKTNI
jgi:hypothetical protein